MSLAELAVWRRARVGLYSYPRGDVSAGLDGDDANVGRVRARGIEPEKRLGDDVPAS